MTKSDSWKVGIIMSETGVTGAIERTQIAAARLAIEEINTAGGVLGRPIAAIARDTGSVPQRYHDCVRELCRQQQIRVFFGGHMSSSRKAMLPAIEAHDAVLFYPTLYEGFEYSRNCIYTGAAPNQNSVPMVDYLFAECGRSLFIVGSDYVYPRESNRIVSDLFRLKGGRVLGESYVPLELRDQDIARVIDRILALCPEVIYSTVVGDGIVPFYEAFRSAGFDPWKTPIASQSTSEIDVARMKPGTADGHVIAAPFFDSMRSAAALRFARALRASGSSGQPATAPAEAAYFSVHLFARALAIAGDDLIDNLLPALFEVEVEAPQGPVRIDPRTNHTHLWPRVARIREQAPYDIVRPPTGRVAPDPFLLDIEGFSAGQGDIRPRSIANM